MLIKTETGVFLTGKKQTRSFIHNKPWKRVGLIPRPAVLVMAFDFKYTVEVLSATAFTQDFDICRRNVTIIF